MCCFTRPVSHVGSTRIFARRLPDGRQLLVYAMSVAAAEDLAMVLPLPVGPGGLRFLDLSAEPDLFAALDACFPALATLGRGPAPQPAPLPVERVGAFDASFVPSLADFPRLDPRFRLDPELWQALGAADRGFAVFQLHGRRSWWRTPTRAVHPMGLVFDGPGPALFFPTVHVHDGAAHPTVAFDHTLYLQAAARPYSFPEGFALSWERAGLAPPPGELFADGQALWRAGLRGVLPNRDVVLPLGALVDDALVARVARARLGEDAEAALALLAGLGPAWVGGLAAERRLAALRVAPDLDALRALLPGFDTHAEARARGPRVTARFAPGVPYDAVAAQALAREDEREWERWLAEVAAPS